MIMVTESKLARVEIEITDEAIMITETSNLGHASMHQVTGERRERTFAALGYLMRQAHNIAESTVHTLPGSA